MAVSHPPLRRCAADYKNFLGSLHDELNIIIITTIIIVTTVITRNMTSKAFVRAKSTNDYALVLKMKCNRKIMILLILLIASPPVEELDRSQIFATNIIWPKEYSA